MKVNDKHNERVAKMTFASVYPHYITKEEKKGRTIDELHEVLEWLTGFDAVKVKQLVDEKVTIEHFFEQASINP